jgi:hypothetical protein
LCLQKTSDELDEEARDGADWQGGYDGMVEIAREAATALTALQARVGEMEKLSADAMPYRKKMEAAISDAGKKLAEIHILANEARTVEGISIALALQTIATLSEEPK